MKEQAASDGSKEPGVSDMHEYMTQVHTGCEQRYGVGILQIGPDLFGPDMMKEMTSAMKSGVSPTAFVESVGKSFSLVEGDKTQTTYRAALHSFVNESTQWEPDGQGGIVTMTDNGIVRMSVEKSSRPDFGAEFSMAIAEGVELELSDAGPIVPEGTEFTEVARAVDIDLALRAFDADYVPTTSMKHS